MNTNDIVHLREELKSEGAPRMAKYDYLMLASGGDYETRRLEGIWKNFKAILGKLDVPFDRETFEFRLNMIPSIIGASRSFISTIPSLRCPAAKPDDTESLAAAEKLERVYLGFWQSSYIGKRMNQLGYFNPQLGNTIGVVWPDIKNKRPMLQMRSPYGFYPIIRDVDGFDLSTAIFTTTYRRRDVRANYPNLSISGDSEKCEVTQYIDEKQIVTIVDDTHRVNEIENKWGFVPIVIIPNETFGEGPWGDSDIEWVIPLQAEHNYRQTMQNVILQFMQLQPLAVEDGEESVPDEWGMGIMDTIPVKAGGSVSRVAPPQIPYQVFQAQQDSLKMIDRIGNTPEVMRSEFSGQVATGKGVSALLGPTQMRQNIKGNEIYPAIAVLNKMAMRMWNAMWGKEEHTVFSLDTSKKSKGNVNVETFEPAEFAPWFENIVYVDQSSFFDAQAKFMIVLQAVQNRLMSRRLAASQVPGVDDAVVDQAQVNRELQEDMQMAQGNVARDEANVQPNVAAQGALNANLTKGYAAKMPVPQTIGGFEAPPLEGEEEQPGEESNMLQDMIEFFGEVPKLTGKVWLAGGIVTDPSYSVDSPAYTGVEVFLEVSGDKSAINQKMRDEYPDVWGNLVYHTGEPGPDEPSILVFDPEGPTDEDLPPDLGQEDPGQEMPPEMEGMLSEMGGGAMAGSPPDMGGMPPEMMGGV